MHAVLEMHFVNLINVLQESSYADDGLNHHAAGKSSGLWLLRLEPDKPSWYPPTVCLQIRDDAGQDARLPYLPPSV